MMFYTFVKDSSGSVQRVGADCSVPPEFVEKLTAYTNDGCTAGEAEEWDQQVINGAKAGMVADPSLPTSAPASEVAEEAAGTEAAAQ